MIQEKRCGIVRSYTRRRCHECQQISTIDLNDEVLLTDNNKLHILLDRLNLLLAQGY
ncbi:MAG: hypothetical protein IPH94_19185 [Saprospiraceae bacterium]|nr:hypothetical protein [Saprospiraceae bacterium]